VLNRRFYHTSQFAHKAAVSVRTLRYYDKVGLLPPSQYTESGHRLYSDDDLLSLQQILALKFLGFSLDEIKRYLQANPQRFQDILAKQKAMMRDKRAQLDAIIQALEEAEKLLSADHCNWETLVQVIQVIQMQHNNDWVSKYFTPEQRQTLGELSDQSYSEEAKRQLAGRGEWTEEDQKAIDQQYAFLAAELRRLVAEGADPGSPDAQAVAKLQSDLIFAFTQGNPEIQAGLKTLWQKVDALPKEQRPITMPWGEQEAVFLSRALEIYRQHQGESGGA
jgi:MerR family transcriptional regulator, thiopeptide resistance regulator